MREHATFQMIIGQALKQWREQRGERQEVVALAARRWGLAWSANVVALIEAGRRHLTLEEFLLFPSVLADLSGPRSWLELFQPSAERVAVTPATSTTLDAVLDLVAHAGAISNEGYRMSFDTPRSRQSAAWNTGTGPSPTAASRRGTYSVSLGVHDTILEIDRKAARKFQTTAPRIVVASIKRWGRSLMEEREQRLARAGHDLASPRRAQALRGSITRTLLEELRPLVARPRRRSRIHGK